MGPQPECPVCGRSGTAVIHTGTDRLLHTTGEKFSIVRCLGCGMARLEPQPRDLHQYYPEHYWFDPHKSAAGRLEQTYRMLVLHDHVRFARQALGCGTKVLDVGCGEGLFLRMLRQPGVCIFGMDISARAASMARRGNGVPAIVADPLHMPFPNGSLDMVTMYHVLEHLQNPRQALISAQRLLAKDGILIVQVPNLDCWQYHLFRSRWNGLDIPRHLHHFRLLDLRRLLVSCGFRITRVKHFSLRDNPAGLATTLLPRLNPVWQNISKRESPVTKLLKDLLYATLTVAALPFTAFEAWFGHGSSVMVEAHLIS